MNITLFAQIIRKLDRYSFKKIVTKYQTDKHSKGINSWAHMVSMIFCHLAKANSLREIREVDPMGWKKVLVNLL